MSIRSSKPDSCARSTGGAGKRCNALLLTHHHSPLVVEHDAPTGHRWAEERIYGCRPLRDVAWFRLEHRRRPGGSGCLVVCWLPAWVVRAPPTTAHNARRACAEIKNQKKRERCTRRAHKHNAQHAGAPGPSVPLAATCTDGAKNGSETDVDAAASARCANTRACRSQHDCASALCVSGVCKACRLTESDCGIDADGPCECQTHNIAMQPQSAPPASPARPLAIVTTARTTLSASGPVLATTPASSRAGRSSGGTRSQPEHAKATA